jgi:DHA3 family macrolide efflux protein-like MFS transporter
LSIALLFLAGRLEVWHIYIVVAVSSTFSAFQWPAYSAATTLLVSKENLGRASGMVQLSEAAAQIGAFVLAGALMGVILATLLSVLAALVAAGLAIYSIFQRGERPSTVIALPS